MAKRNKMYAYRTDENGRFIDCYSGLPVGRAKKQMLVGDSEYQDWGSIFVEGEPPILLEEDGIEELEQHVETTDLLLAVKSLIGEI